MLTEATPPTRISVADTPGAFTAGSLPDAVPVGPVVVEELAVLVPELLPQAAASRASAEITMSATAPVVRRRRGVGAASVVLVTRTSPLELPNPPKPDTASA